ncbi:hypothetical protein L7F22_013395 [Adiantum nelumboides]|nr:hypothetical protein [Adiantum nelumboides]
MAKNKAYESWFGNVLGAQARDQLPSRKLGAKAFHQNIDGMTRMFPNGMSIGSGAKGPDAADKGELAQEGSACSTQIQENAYECKNPELEGEHAAIATDATTSIACKSALLIHHVIVSDLAATVKILTKVVARPPRVV